MNCTTKYLVYRCIIALVLSAMSNNADALPQVSSFDDGIALRIVPLPTDRKFNHFASIEEVSYINYSPPVVAFPKSPVVCEDCVCGTGRKSKIVGGNPSNIVNYPWMVAILKQGVFHCGGSLITRNHVLTAAHCVYRYEKLSFDLILGEEDLSKRPSRYYRRRIKSMVVHENFTESNLDNDIAIIELDTPMPLDNVVKTVCLPQNQAVDYTGSLGIATGWGRIKEGAEPSKQLRSVRLPILSEEECDAAGYHLNRITKNMFCAGYIEGRKDACGGDSGGPLVVEGPFGHKEIIGIISFGRGCARRKFPGVYTKLTNYIGWLHDNLKGECVCRQRYHIDSIEENNTISD